MVLLVTIGVGGCHVRDATISVANVEFLDATLTLTKTDIQFHEVDITVAAGDTETRTIDSGPYLWTIRYGSCIPTGNVTIPAGSSSWKMSCSGLERIA
jgi:hypothetical protein